MQYTMRVSLESVWWMFVLHFAVVECDGGIAGDDLSAPTVKNDTGTRKLAR
jgi:hypothetical protein